MNIGRALTDALRWQRLRDLNRMGQAFDVEYDSDGRLTLSPTAELREWFGHPYRRDRISLREYGGLVTTAHALASQQRPTSKPRGA